MQDTSYCQPTDQPMIEEQVWRSGKSPRGFLPMWPGFDSGPEFVIGFPGFFPLQKTTYISLQIPTRKG